MRHFRPSLPLGALALVLVLYGLGLPFALGIHKPGDGLSLFALSPGSGHPKSPTDAS